MNIKALLLTIGILSFSSLANAASVFIKLETEQGFVYLDRNLITRIYHRESGIVVYADDTCFKIKNMSIEEIVEQLK